MVWSCTIKILCSGTCSSVMICAYICPIFHFIFSQKITPDIFRYRYITEVMQSMVHRQGPLQILDKAHTNRCQVKAGLYPSEGYGVSPGRFPHLPAHQRMMWPEARLVAITSPSLDETRNLLNHWSALGRIPKIHLYYERLEH